MNFKIYLILLSLFLTINLTNTTVTKETCIDPEGKQVDWYIILLFPRKSDENQNINYGYFDENSTTLKYYEYSKENFPPIDFTYIKEKSKAKDTNIIFWNDDNSTENTTGKSSSSKAHSKGGLIYNSKNGRYIMHSLPRFPRRTDNNKIVSDLPENAGIYAQHFLCITIDTTEALNIIDQLIIINPQLVYTHGDEDRVGLNKEQVEMVLTGKADRNRENSARITLKSKNMKKFEIFSKGSHDHNLPYDSLIPENYESNLLVETWTKPKMLNIICNSKYKVYNIQSLKFGIFEYGKDNEHSKWAVLEHKPVTCFSDLNRVAEQKNRGGLTICFKNGNLANIMRKGITDYEKCSKDSFLELESLKFLD